MQKYLNYVTDTSGNVIRTASIHIKLGGTGTDATIYSDNGLTPKANPFSVESSDASYYFYAANGLYDVIVTASGYTFDADDTAGLRLFDETALTVIATGSTTARSLADLFADVFNVLDDGADNTGATDSTAAIQLTVGRIQAKGGGDMIFPPGRYRVRSTTTGNLCQFFNLNGIRLLGYGATIEVWTGKTITASEGTLFYFDNCQNITVDGFRTDGPVLDVSSVTVKGYEFVRCVNGCKNVLLPNNYVKNMLAGFITSKLLGDPDSMRTQNIHIGILDIANCWYGYNGQYSGDYTWIDCLRTNGVHRSFFVYGASHYRVNVWSKDHKSTDILVSSSQGIPMEDVQIFYTSTVDSVSCGTVDKVQLYFAGTVPGFLRNIHIHLDVEYNSSGNTGASAVFITKLLDNGNPDAVDRGHKLENFILTGRIKGSPSYNNGGVVVMESNVARWGTGDFFSNFIIRDFKNEGANANSNINLVLVNVVDQIVLENVVSNYPIQLNRDNSGNPAILPTVPRLVLNGVQCPNRWVASTYQPLDNLSTVATPYTIPSGWAYKTINNANIGGDSVFTLPAAVVGLGYTFVRKDAFVMDLDPSGSEVIRGGTAGQLLRMNTAGNVVRLECFTAGTWEVLSSQGAYSFV